jgi:hypothetical protein
VKGDKEGVKEGERIINEGTREGRNGTGRAEKGR